MSWDNPFDDQLVQIQTHQNNQQAITAMTPDANPQTAALLAAHAQATPWVQPQVQYAMADSGMAPSDPAAQAIAQKSINKKGGGFWSDLGHIVEAPLLLGARAGSTALSGLSNVAQNIKPEIRGALAGLESPLQVVEGGIRDVASATGDIGAGIATGAAAGGGLGALVGGIGAIPGAAGGAVVGGIMGALGQAKGVKVTGGYVNPLTQSTLGQIASHWQSGQPVDLGTGFMPGGQIHQDVVKAQQEAASINGHALTPGRFLANTVAQPGSMTYNLLSGLTDAVTTLGLDPTQQALGAYSEAGKEADVIANETTRMGALPGVIGKKLLGSRAGLLEANAPAIMDDVAQNFLSTDPAAKAFAEKAVDITSADKFRALSNGKITSSVANGLAAATTPQEVTQVLKNAIVNGSLAEKSTLDMGNPISQSFRTWRSGSRLLSAIPGDNISLLDTFKDGQQTPKFDMTMEKLKGWMAQARIGTAEDRENYINDLMQSKSPDDIKDKVKDLITNHYQPQLQAAGHDDETVSKMLGQYYESAGDLLRHSQDAIGRDRSMPGMLLGGAKKAMPKDNHLTETVTDLLPLPDTRALGRLTNPTPGMKQLINSGLWKSTTGTIDQAMQIWRPLAVLRPAWALRILASESAKGAMSGLDMPLANPLQYILHAVTGKTGNIDAEGDLMSRALERMQSMIGIKNSAPSHAGAFLGGSTVLNPEDEGFAKTLAANLITANQDKLGQRIAEVGVDHAAEAFSNGDLADYRMQLAARMNKPELAMQELPGDQQILQPAEQPATHIPGKKATPGRFEETGRTVEAGQYTAQPNLVNPRGNVPGGMRTGTIYGGLGPENLSPEEQAARFPATTTYKESVWIPGEKGQPGHWEYQGKPGSTERVFGPDDSQSKNYVYKTVMSHLNNVTQDNPELWKAIETGQVNGVPLVKFGGSSIINEDAVAELQKMVDDPNIKTPGKLIGRAPAGDGRSTVREMFRSVAGKPVNTLVRNPAFNQSYWNHIEQIAPLMTEDAQATMLENAAKTLPKSRVDELRAAAAKSTGEVTVSEASQAAKYRALDTMHDTFMDFSHRSQWQDAMRTIMPFANHWQQELGQVSSILTENPAGIRKAQMLVHEGQESGFFHKNEQGQWVFNYPGSGLIGQVAGAAPFPMQAKVSGLGAITTSLLPGFGPLMSVASSKLIPNKPEFNSLKTLFSPYGDPTQQGVLQAVMPQWMKSMQAAMSDPKSDVSFSNTVMDTARYLASTGNYDVMTPDGQEKLIADATTRAKHLYVLKALGQAFSPSSPTPQPMAKDQNGNLLTAQMLSTTLAKLYDDDNKNNTNDAIPNFLKQFGDNAILFLQGNTKAISPLPVDTDKGYAWAEEHPDMVKKLPNTYGFFAPQDGQFDYTAYLKTIQNGQRINITPDEMIRLANDKVGSMMYYNIKDKIGAHMSSQQQSVLAGIKSTLEEKLPGFGTASVGLPTKANAAQLITEVQTGLKDPTIAATPVGQASALYLQLRDAALAGLKKPGVQTPSLTTQQAAGYASMLNNAAQVIGQKVPAFNLIFDRVFSRELPSVINGPNTAAPASA